MKVNTDRVFYAHQDFLMMPRVLVYGKYHVVGLRGKYPEISPWFIKWEPHNPCHYCDKGTLVFNPGNNFPKWWHWQYVELGIDADKHDLPHGISFTRGNGHNLSKRAKGIIKRVITYTDSNLVSQREYDYLRRRQYVYRNFDTIEEVILARKRSSIYRYLTIEDFDKVVTIDLKEEDYTIKQKELT